MANIVQQTSKTNHVQKSTFDLSGNVNLTACTGMLLPIRIDDALPNSSYNYDISAFARTIQMVVPSFARVRAHIDTFFVPYRLLGDEIVQTIVGDERGRLSNYADSGAFSGSSNKSLPYWTIEDLTVQDSKGLRSWQFQDDPVDAAGVKYSVSSPILLNSLGYGFPATGSWNDVSIYGYGPRLSDDNAIASAATANLITDGSVGPNTLKFGLLPLLAYQKIYQDYYRNKLWEKENRLSYYIPSSEMGTDLTDYVKTRGIMEMRYHDYDKDRLLGLVPDEGSILSLGISQYASSVLAGATGLDSNSVFGNKSIPEAYYNSAVAGVETDKVKSTSDYLRTFSTAGATTVSNGNILMPTSGDVLVQQYTAITNRRMEAFQKFAEICQLNKSDYKNQISAHFGFTPSDLNSDYCTLVGSCDIPLQISDVENTSATDTGSLAGKGVLSGSGRSFSVQTKEHGLIMSILYLVPQIDWSSEALDRVVMRFNRYDFAIPEFDRLGFEPVRLCDYFGFVPPSDLDPTVNNYSPFKVVGYLPRYWYYKTKLDSNQTGFSSDNKTSLSFNNYLVQYDKKRIYAALTAGSMFEALKSRPSDLDSLFPTAWSDMTSNQFVFSIHVNCKAALPLSIDSLPY